MTEDVRRLVPAGFGLCMEGNEELICEALDVVTRRMPTCAESFGAARPLVYVEIGAAAGETMRGVEAFVTQHPTRRDWRLVGVDIPGGWSLDLGAIKRNTGCEPVYPARDGWNLKAATKQLVLQDAQVFLMRDWNSEEKIHVALVDGCHGSACAAADFLALENLMAMGGVILFHDASEGCQGAHFQPHCQTGIAVRAALRSLGLLDNSRPGWRLFGEAKGAAHGIVAVQRSNGLQMTPLPPESQEGALVGSPGWTPHHEVKWLRWFAGRVGGDILEIGCNNGQTTLELATAWPQKQVFALDYTGADTPMCDGQRSEQPGAAQVCEMARHLPNVTVLDQPSGTLSYERDCPNAGFVFIDGDHSYEGVSKDTELAMGHAEFVKRTSGRVVVIVWHDVCETHPEWVEVLKYLEREIAPWRSVSRVEGTWVAWILV